MVDILISILEIISQWAIITFVMVIVIWGFIYGIKNKSFDIYGSFVTGAKEGFTTAIGIIPFLVAMLVAIGIFRDSGAMDFLTAFISIFTTPLGVPPEVIPMAIMRPLSGGGAMGIATDLIHTYGPDSLIGNMASVMMGSTETTLYVIALYFGSVGIKKERHALAAGLIADLAGLIAAISISLVMWG